MGGRKIKKYELIEQVIQSSHRYPSAEFLKQLPSLVKKYLPLSNIILYHKNSKGDNYYPFSDDFPTSELIVLNEKARIISAFAKNCEPFLLNGQENVYLEIFNKDTHNLFSEKKLNLIVPVYFRRHFHGLLLARLDKKHRKLFNEIVDALLTVFGVFIPRIEMERMELKNDRNYYKLFKFDRLVLLGEMVASFAHEFRTPLHTIQLELKELADQVEEEEAAASLDKVNRQISRLRQLINSLLSFSRVQDIVKEDIRLKSYIETLLDEIPKKRIPSSLGIQIKMDETISVYSDKNRLRQVITNILFNAFDVVDESGIVEIDAYSEFQDSDKEKVYVITIKDNGPGIPQEIKERIFEPFFTTRQNGTGLGLYIAYGIMKTLKGELDVESSPGGTTFYITIPGGKIKNGN